MTDAELPPVEVSMETTALLEGGEGEGGDAAEQQIIQKNEKGDIIKNPAYANLYTLQNAAILMSYINVGIALNYLITPVSYYLVDTLDAASTITNTYSCLQYLPWCFKIFFGVASDLYPIFGARRKPYFVLGWLISIVSMLIAWAIGDPGVEATLGLTFLSTFGQLLSDTIADAMIVEAAEHEELADKGRMRTQGYLVRSAGYTVGGLMGACLYNKSSWGWGLSIGQCFLIQALLPLFTVLPFVPGQLELPYRGKLVSLAQTYDICYNWIRVDAVWLPAMYLFLYDFMYISNPAWYNFLYDGLGFSDFEVGIMYTFSALLSVAGIWIFDTFFFNREWSWIYIWTTLVSAGFSGLQLMLCYGKTFGLPDIVFATGDISLQTAVQYVTFMPMCIMFLALIPPGLEGTLYAMITTWMNVATEMGYDVGTLMECFISVSNDELEGGDFSGVILLTYITTALQITPVFFVHCRFKGIRWVPDNADMVRAQVNYDNVDDVGAMAFVIMFFGSIILSIVESVWVVVYPNAC